ncbi:MAG: DUF1929 domain-containing protein [Planctomycetes bacterium]|nr:DUF1929 domain-containing protein [Planctomycetota bacterium]MBI3833404.1 DUF1929 domain-containing protein [Planctomycetota bacterium]
MRNWSINCKLSAVCVAAILGSPSFTDAATVTGEVRRSTPPNDPIANARVTVFDAGLAFFREARTDLAGAYSIPNVPSGNYQVGCAALHFAYLESPASVSSGALQRDFSLGLETQQGRWDIIGTTEPEVLDGTDIGVLLSNGSIFYCHDTVDPILFNPVNGSKTFPSGSGLPSGCMNGSMLEDGKVIFVGGQNGEDPGNFVDAVPWVKTYSQPNDTWQRLADLQLSVGRWYPGLARLADGSLLVMGGGTCCQAVRTNTCERFDLNTQTWSFTGSMLDPVEFPPSALLYTGEVLATWSRPQLYNPGTGLWRATGAFNQPTRGWPNHCDHSIVVLEDGRVLAIGIRQESPSNMNMGEIYDPSTGTWTLTSNPGLLRFQSEVVQLPDGRILVAAGETQAIPPPVPTSLGIVKWTDLYDPGTDFWRRVADMNWFREYHAVTLLIPDGRVLTTGGTRIKFQVGPTSNDIEAFSPPYLFRGVRPQITSVSTNTLGRGASLTLNITPETQITSIALMGTQTTTHWVDGGVPRRLVLPMSQTGAQVVATLPADPNVLPLGHYMVFAMVDDIPSNGIIVQIVEATQAIPALSSKGIVTTAVIVIVSATWILCRRSRNAWLE